MPELEIRVPISPVRHFFKQVEALAASARVVGAPSWDVKFVISVGAETVLESFPTTGSLGSGVSWRTIHPDAFRSQSYMATIRDRHDYGTSADVVILADADVLITGSIERLLEDVVKHQVVAGVIAHAAPPGEGWSWDTVFAAAGLPKPRHLHQYTGWPFMAGPDAQRFCPTYFNFGAVVVAAPLLDQLCRGFEAGLAIATRSGFRYFAAQVGLALGLAQESLPAVALPLRYNFPNDPRFERAYGAELTEARIIHYLRTAVIDRSHIWSTAAETSAFLERRDLEGANETVRRTAERLAHEGALTL